jgi:hypothetical protein
MPRVELESAAQYLDHVAGVNLKKRNKWIEKICQQIPLEEQRGDAILTLDDEKLLRYHPDYFVITGTQWKDMNVDDLTNFRLLAFTRDARLRTIRDLTSDQIDLLRMMKEETLATIAHHFPAIAAADHHFPGNIRIFFHYHPKTYLLHIHFVHASAPVEPHEYNFDEVMGILSDPVGFQREIEVRKF